MEWGVMKGGLLLVGLVRRAVVVDSIRVDSGFFVERVEFDSLYLFVFVFMLDLGIESRRPADERKKQY
jgi:hypothetical protein